LWSDRSQATRVKTQNRPGRKLFLFPSSYNRHLLISFYSGSCLMLYLLITTPTRCR
jgi:hypothetical protein